ncbi:MAG: thiamine pyrophosphate-dependent enzyme [Capsulimonadaceae bacterium]
MKVSDRMLLSGDEAVALGAYEAGVALGTGYPGTPSTEILETFAELGGRAQWAPNEKVALEVGMGAAFGSARALVTMKHVGLNVAADALFTIAYADISGALVVVSADDPGMASSQNEQDNRRYAVAAAVPMLEPADSQEAYEFTHRAIEISERWHVPVLLRMTTRICHSKTIVRPRPGLSTPPPRPIYTRDIARRVMVPSNARPAHRRLRSKLAQMAEWNESCGPNTIFPGDGSLGIICSGAAFPHVREAVAARPLKAAGVAPEAAILKLGMTYPLPITVIRRFTESIPRTVVIEEGDPWLADAIRAAGIPVDDKPEMYRFGELNVARVRRILAGDTTPEQAPPSGKPPKLCPGCPHRSAFEVLRKLDCIVAGDIGCYTLGALAPFEALEMMICMGAAVGMGLGLRHVLAPEQARRVVSVIGDGTFVHSGITGLVEMVYNPPLDGHVLIILDNGTTAMTGMQEHPGTGRTLNHRRTGKLVFEDLARSLGIRHVHVVDPARDPLVFEETVARCLESRELAVIIARHHCVLAAGKIRQMEMCVEDQT